LSRVNLGLNGAGVPRGSFPRVGAGRIKRGFVIKGFKFDAAREK
jgi:hypothetical protein